MASRTALSVAALAALSACAPPRVSTALEALSLCGRASSHVEMRDTGTIVRVLGERRSTSGDHEGFIIAIPMHTASGAFTQGVARNFKVEDNVDITGPVPLQRGDRVALQGQLECDDYVIHWTHHDPRGRHIGGYIEVNGRRYQ